MIPIYMPWLGKEELKNVAECISTGWVSSKGEFVRQFERDMARYIGKNYGVATSSGTTALHLALVTLGIKSGDEVIVPTLTFVASANAVVYTGAKPVFVDSHPKYWCIDPELIEKKITKRTKAIIAVHLYGHPCDMDAIMDIAKRRGLYVVEDVAEAQGATYKGKKAGTFGDISCFSFFGNKVITTGEGGMCLTDDRGLNERMRILRDHGMNPEKRYWHDVVGFNYRMTNLQAALGVAQLGKIDTILDKKRAVAGLYNRGLANSKVMLPPKESWAEPVMWIYTVLVENRDEIMLELDQAGVDTRPMFYPVHLFPPYREEGEYPIAMRLSSMGVSLPSSSNLKKSDIEKICKVISENSVPTP